MSYSPSAWLRGRSATQDKSADTLEAVVNEKEAFEQLRVRADEFSAGAPERMHFSDEDLHRFLRARKYNVDPAFVLMETSEKWRIENTPVDPKSIQPEIQSGLAQICGLDKKGRAIVYVDVTTHDKNKRDLANTTKLAVWIIMTAIEVSQKHHQEQLVFIFDIYNFGIKTMDYAMMKELLKLLSDAFPERVGHLLVMRAPSVFKGFWAVIKPWIDEGTAAKIKFIEPPALDEFVDRDQLPANLGGKHEFENFLKVYNT